MVELPQINKNGSVLSPYPATGENSYHEERRGGGAAEIELKPVSKDVLKSVFASYRKVLAREL